MLFTFKVNPLHITKNTFILEIQILGWKKINMCLILAYL